MNFLTRFAFSLNNRHTVFYYTIAALFLSSVLVSCSDPETNQPIPTPKPVVTVPKGFPEVPAPVDNSLTSEKIELGRLLFYDKQLSKDRSVACVDCHKQNLAFTDGLPVSKGVGGEIGGRNSPTIVNTAYLPLLFLDGRAHSLEEQIKGALFSPIEMYADESTVNTRLQADEAYQKRFKNVFGNDSVPNAELAVKAIASFVRTVLSGNSKYDRYTHGETSALNESEKAGMTLFFSEKTQCSSCHQGFNFTDNLFHSTGLYVHYYDKGRALVTHKPEDEGTFKTPSLRNIELTTPYMHDGSVTTLEKVLEHYNHGGKAFKNKDKRIVPLNLSEKEKSDLIAFLRCLTDNELIVKTEYSKP